MKWICLLLLIVLLLCSPHGAQAQTAQESIERSLGALIVQNATCSAQGLQAQEELRKVKAELAELKAKQLVEPAK